MWHASVALRTELGDTVPTDQASAKDGRLAEALARRFVDHVGCGVVIGHTKFISWHARRRLSDTELRLLDPAWLAIEPVDMG